MKRLLVLLLIIIQGLGMTSCDYRDIDKLLFITAIVVDVGEKAGTYDIFFEAFRPSSSSNQEKQEGERIIYGVTDSDIMAASDQLSNYANLPVSFALTKMLLFTREIAEQGLDNHINLWHHAFDFTIRTYIGIWDADPKEFEEIELKGEKFLGIYLRTHINNAEQSTSHVERMTLLDIMNASAIKDKVLPIPLIKPVKKGKTQLLDFPGVALVRNYKMVGEVPKEKSNYLFYMSNDIHRDFVQAGNPDADNTPVISFTVTSKTKTLLVPQNDRMKVQKSVKSRLLLAGSQKTISLDDQTLAEMKKQMEDTTRNSCMDLYKIYSSQGVDIYNLGESIYRKYPWFDQKNLFDKIDFSVDVSYEIQGTAYKFDFNLPEKHNMKK